MAQKWTGEILREGQMITQSFEDGAGTSVPVVMPLKAAQAYFERGLALCTNSSKTATAAAPSGKGGRGTKSAKKKGMKGGKGC